MGALVERDTAIVTVSMVTFLALSVSSLYLIAVVFPSYDKTEKMKIPVEAEQIVLSTEAVTMPTGTTQEADNATEATLSVATVDENVTTTTVLATTTVLTTPEATTPDPNDCLPPRPDVVSDLPQAPPYTGRQSRPEPGRACLAWSELEQFSIIDAFLIDFFNGDKTRFFPESSLQDMHNYCRVIPGRTEREFPECYSLNEHTNTVELLGCQTPICMDDIDNCDHNLCLNGGTCVDGVHSYTCTCPQGFSGVHCQTEGCIAEYYSDAVELSGRVTQAESGRPCLYWADVDMHDTSSLEGNGCRNIMTQGPDEGGLRNSEGRAWCYVLGEGSLPRAEYCHVPICDIDDCTPQVDYNDENETNVYYLNLNPPYTGNIAVTAGGEACAEWAAVQQLAQAAGDTATLALTLIMNFPDPDYTQLANKCRNPSFVFGPPWCYVVTADSYEAHSCDVPFCSSDINNCNPNLCLNGGSCVDGPHSFTCSCPPGHSGNLCQTQTCRDPYAAYEELRESESVSQYGRPCLHWQYFPDSDPQWFSSNDISAVASICIDNQYWPEGAFLPWCINYIDGTQQRASCAVPVCDVFQDCYVPGFPHLYAGQANLDGACYDWAPVAGADAVRYFIEPRRFVDETLEEASNYCRDVLDMGEPWCIANDANGDVGFVECELPQCQGSYAHGVYCFSSPCLNGAACTSDGSTAVCVCPEGYSGQLCETGPEDFICEHGQEYVGDVAVSRLGETCVSWYEYLVLTREYSDSIIVGSFPDDTWEQLANKCRMVYSDWTGTQLEDGTMVSAHCHVFRDSVLSTEYCNVPVISC